MLALCLASKTSPRQLVRKIMCCIINANKLEGSRHAVQPRFGWWYPMLHISYTPISIYVLFFYKYVGSVYMWAVHSGYLLAKCRKEYSLVLFHFKSIHVMSFFLFIFLSVFCSALGLLLSAVQSEVWVCWDIWPKALLLYLHLSMLLAARYAPPCGYYTILQPLSVERERDEVRWE